MKNNLSNYRDVSNDFSTKESFRKNYFGNHDAKSLIYSLLLIFLSPFFTLIYMMIRI